MIPGNAETEHLLPSTEAYHAMLPMMTALFVTGLKAERRVRGYGAEWFPPGKDAGGAARVSRVALSSDRGPSAAPLGAGMADAGNPEERDPRQTPFAAKNRPMDARSLIRLISHHYNNLLMAIWGNTTLIRMQLGDGDPLEERTLQMERIIQSGAFLTHMVLGYLGERRTAAKRIRLHQLIREIQQGMPTGHRHAIPDDIEAQLRWASRVQTPAIIAEATGRVMAFLFETLLAHGTASALRLSGDGEIEKKWAAIHTLVMRGLAMAQQLRRYAADTHPHVEQDRVLFAGTRANGAGGHPPSSRGRNRHRQSIPGDTATASCDTR